MSKDITIQEGGTARTFTGVTKLKTAKAGGGSCYWVPEDERQLGHKSITADGTYYAATDGYYGFEYVVVNGITGKDPNADDDDDHNITVDPETGDLVNTRLPASIAITTEPDKTIYVDGETIDLTGLVVKAYYADGTEWGTVPAAEIVCDTQTADTSQTAQESTATSELLAEYPTITNPIPLGAPTATNGYNVTIDFSGSTEPCTGYKPYGDSASCIAASASTDVVAKYTQTDGSNGQSSQIFSYSHGGKTVYYAVCGMRYKYGTVTPDCGLRGTDSGATVFGVVAWTMVYGTVTQSGTQTITLSWPRPGDGLVLSDSFAVTVVDAAV